MFRRQNEVKSASAEENEKYATKNDNIDYMNSTSRNPLLTHPDDIESFIDRVSVQKILALDTEFLRVSTYFPTLCLIQLASADGSNALIDPLEIEADQLKLLLEKISGVFVLHSASQDLEVLSGALGFNMPRLFDTQVAYAMVGEEDQLGYAALVEKFLGVSLTKAFTRTDWCQRPLSAGQIEYAIHDVEYLCDIHELLKAKLESSGKLNWALEEFENRTTLAYQYSEESLFKKFRGLGDLSPIQQNKLKCLVMWREQVAQQKNRPREWIVSNLDLLTLAKSETTTIAQLKELKVDSRAMNRYGSQILQAFEENRDAIHSGKLIWSLKKPLTADQRTELKQLKSRLQSIAVDYGISPGLIANSKDLECILREETGRLNYGWRSTVCKDLF